MYELQAAKGPVFCAGVKPQIIPAHDEEVSVLIQSTEVLQEKKNEEQKAGALFRFNA